jgi:DNA-binding CsgD family transcriptional regulator
VTFAFRALANSFDHPHQTRQSNGEKSKPAWPFCVGLAISRPKKPPKLFWLTYRHSDSPSTSRAASLMLNEREIEVLTWVARGKTSGQIAQTLRLTKRTVDFHLDNARMKLGAPTPSRPRSASLSSLEASRFSRTIRHPTMIPPRSARSFAR